MAKLGEQLQQARPTRTQRVGEQQRVERLQKLQGIERQRVQTKVDTASATMQNISYEDYETEYNKLDTETKPYFTSPEKLKQTEGYKSYLVEKAEYDKQVASYEAQQRSIADAQREKTEWEQAEKYMFKAKHGMGYPYDRQSGVGRKIDKLYRHREMAMEDIEATNIRALAKQGIKPIRKGAVVVAYKDEFGNVSYSPTLEGLQVKRDPDVVYAEHIKKYPPKTQDPIIEEVKISDVVDDRKWYDKSAEDLFIGKAREKVKTRYSKVIGGIKFDKIKEDWGKIPSPPTILETPKIKTMEEFDIKIAEQQKIQSERIGLEDIKEKYATISQTAFERDYAKDIIYETKTFEQASAEFEQSAEALQISKDYQSEVNKELGALGFTKEGFKMAGLQTGKFAVSLIPTRTKDLVLTLGVAKVGYSAYKGIPNIIKSMGFTGLGVYEGAKLISPLSTPTQRAGAVLTLGTLGLSGAYAGTRWLRSPVPIKTIIPKPIKDIKTYAKGYDIKVLTDQGVVDLAVFPEQKLMQQALAGQRTIVKTKGSLLLEKYTGIKLKPLYEGVPISQAKYSVEGLGAEFSYSDPSGYQKAYKKFTKYGYTPSEARASLRLTAPKIQELYLEKGIIKTSKGKAVADFEHLIKRPVVEVDELLGIKTRGAKTIKVASVEERILKDQYFKTEKITGEFVLKDGKLFEFKDIKYGKGVGFGKATDLRKEYIPIPKDKIIFTEEQVKDLYGVSISRDLLPSSKAIHLDTSRTQLISKVIDLQTKQIGGVSPSFKKTPFAKTFARDVVEDVKKIVYGKPSTQISKLIPEQSQINIQQLKSAITPDVKQLTEIKGMIKAKQLPQMKSKIIPAVTMKELLDIKADVKLKSSLKSMVSLKDLLKEDTILKTKQVVSPALRFDLKLKTDIKTLTGISLKTPIPRIPKPPVIKIPTIPIPLWLKSAIRGKMKKKKKGEFEEFALLPDFTSRAIGLKPDIISGKQAQARIRKILTGMEVRRGVIIQ